MRMAVFEMLACPDIPIRVTLNEAIDIGKRFGAEESGAFINGILDSIHQAVEEEGAALVAADEVFVCNSVIAIWPVTRLITDQGRSPEWPVGPLTRLLQSRLVAEGIY